MEKIRWFECGFSADDITREEHVKFKEEMELAFHIAGWPAQAAVVGEARTDKNNIRLWITSIAAEAAEANGFKWRKFYTRDLAEAPFKRESALLVGRKVAWNLLRDGGKDPFTPSGKENL